METLTSGYTSLSSEELVAVCANSGDEAAWEEFVKRFQPMIARTVLRTARRFVPPPRYLLDDLIQETFLKLCGDDCLVLRRFQSRHKDSIFGYLASVAASVVLDHFKFRRARKRNENKTEPISEQIWIDVPTARRHSPVAIEDRILLRQIDELLCKLFQGEQLIRNRTIFWLHNREGMTASAIASIPSIGLNTKGVESTLRRMTLMIQNHMGTTP